MAQVEAFSWIIEEYVDAVQAELLAQGRGADRIVPIAPGMDVAWDDPCNGYLYARVESIVPHVQVPRPAASGCRVAYFVVTVAMGLLRCAATVDSRGNPPTPAQIGADGLEMTADIATMAHVLQANDRTRDIVRWLPLGPQGGMHGGEWFFTFQVGALGMEG